jgi:quercetin dioxygenase-like cupin family protein
LNGDVAFHKDFRLNAKVLPLFSTRVIAARALSTFSCPGGCVIESWHHRELKLLRTSIAGEYSDAAQRSKSINKPRKQPMLGEVQQVKQSANETELRNTVSLPSAGRAEKVLGVTHIYRLEEQQTGGRLACLDLTIPPDHGVPPHTHHLEDELFYVIDGAVEITGDDLAGPALLEKGALFYGPRGRMHGFHNPTDTPSHLLVLMTPGSNMQRMFAALAALTSSSQGFPKPEEVKTLCAEYEITFA